mmetsp:Transcript_1671/g.3798  ORF Transcript_1671/g.3798 Transcript_1671/m.3798 type:complete len:98 (+) Transcript_1671:1193-1486(+)
MSCGNGVKQSLEEEGTDDGSSIDDDLNDEDEVDAGDENASVGLNVDVENVPTAKTSKKICTDIDPIVIVAAEMLVEWLLIEVKLSTVKQEYCGGQRN